MFPNRLLFLASLVALLHTSCSTFQPQEDPTRYFALKATSSGRLASSPVAAGIGPVTVPGYLDHKEIVTAGPNNELMLAEFHVWAEALDKAVPRVVAKDVSRLLNSPAVVPFPDADVKQDYRVSIILRRFEMGADKRVRLDASYSIEGSPGSGRAGRAKSRSITRAVVQPDDPAAIVDAMSRALGDLSSSIAKDLLALDRAHPSGGGE